MISTVKQCFRKKSPSARNEKWKVTLVTDFYFYFAVVGCIYFPKTVFASWWTSNVSMHHRLLLAALQKQLFYTKHAFNTYKNGHVLMIFIIDPIKKNLCNCIVWSYRGIDNFICHKNTIHNLHNAVSICVYLISNIFTTFFSLLVSR